MFQTLTLAIIVILLACRINNFYKGATKIIMIWMHLFNFFTFIIIPVVIDCSPINDTTAVYHTTSDEFIVMFELYLQLFVAYLIYRFVLNMQNSKSTDEVIGKKVPFTTFMRNHRAYKLAS